MINKLQNLEKIGLTKGEIKVYEALLKLGECTKTALAKESGVAPANIYDITNRLSAKGLISTIDKNNVKHFSPANPKRILDFLVQKKEEIDKEKNIVLELLPTLEMAYKESGQNTKVESFIGWSGMQNIFEDLLSECKKGDLVEVYGASIGENDTQSDIFFLKYSRLREKKGIFTKIIFNEDVKTRKNRISFFLNSKQYEIKFLKQTSITEIMTYKDVAIILILTENPIGIRLKDQKVADSFRQHFNLLWKMSQQ